MRQTFRLITDVTQQQDSVNFAYHEINSACTLQYPFQMEMVEMMRVEVRCELSRLEIQIPQMRLFLGRIE